MFEVYFKKIKNISSRSDRSSRGLHLSIDVSRDWIILSTLILITISALLVADIYLFYTKYVLVQDIAKINTEDLLNLNTIRLKKTVDDLQTKELRFNKIVEERIILVDPSL